MPYNFQCWHYLHQISKQTYEQDSWLQPSVASAPAPFLSASLLVSAVSGELGKDPDGLWSIFWKGTNKSSPNVSNGPGDCHLPVITCFRVTRDNLVRPDRGT